MTLHSVPGPLRRLLNHTFNPLVGRPPGLRGKSRRRLQGAPMLGAGELVVAWTLNEGRSVYCSLNVGPLWLSIFFSIDYFCHHQNPESRPCHHKNSFFVLLRFFSSIILSPPKPWGRHQHRYLFFVTTRSTFFLLIYHLNKSLRRFVFF